MKNIFKLIYVLPMMLLAGCAEDLSDMADGSFSPSGTTSLKAVDIGLSVKWANSLLKPNSYYYNYGTSICYFPFGAGKDDLIRENMEYGNISGTRYDASKEYGGNSWRTPTKEEFQELIDKCTLKISMSGGDRGVLVTGPNGKSIFIRAANNTSNTIILWTSSFQVESSKASAYTCDFTMYDIKDSVNAEFGTTTDLINNNTYSFNSYEKRSPDYEYHRYYPICPVQNK